MKTTIFALIIFFICFSSDIGNAKTKWHITISDGTTLFNTTLEKISNDTLSVYSDGKVEHYAIQDILRLQYSETSSDYLLTTTTGAVVCGGLGYLLGDMEDKYGDDGSSEALESKLIWSVAGATVGGVLGAFAGNSSTKNIDYDIQGFKLEEKRNILESIIAGKKVNYYRKGRKADVVYLRKGGKAEGNVDVNPSDSSVTLTAIDGSTSTYKHSEILMVSQTDPTMHDDMEADWEDNYLNNRMHVEAHLGVSFPIGGFSDVLSGAAITGFTIEGRFVYPLTRNPQSTAFQSVTSLYGSFNGLIYNVPQKLDVSIGAWNLIYPMTGIRWMTSSTGDYDFSLMAQAGLLFGAFPSSKSGQNTYQASATSTAFAYRAGMGILLRERFMFELSYTDSNPEYSVSGIIEGVAYRRKINQSTSLITLTAGLIFSF